MVCYRADDVVITKLPNRKCDCGAPCTQCTDCAVAEYQAQQSTCKTCCPVRGARAPLTLQDGAQALLEAIDRYHDLTGETDCDVRATLERLREVL